MRKRWLGRDATVPREIGSALIPPVEDNLWTSDQLLRNQLSEGWPEEWSGPAVSSVGEKAVCDQLVRLYFAVLLENQGKREESGSVLDDLVSSCSPGAIQVSALRFLIDQLWIDSINAMQVSDGEYLKKKAHLHEMCALVDREYSASVWSNVICFVSDSARGVLSYYEGDLVSCKIYLKRADNYRALVERSGNFGIDTLCGMSDLVRGEMCVQEGAFEEASRFLVSATGRLREDVQAEAFNFLSVAEFRLGRFQSARESAERGISIRRAMHSGRDGRDDNLEYTLAETMIQLGQYEEARGVLQEIARSGVIEGKRVRAMQLLRKIERH